MANAFDQFDSGGAAVAEKNPFDQFDKAASSPTANPFDKFDAASAAAPAKSNTDPKETISALPGIWESLKSPVKDWSALKYRAQGALEKVFPGTRKGYAEGAPPSAGEVAEQLPMLLPLGVPEKLAKPLMAYFVGSTAYQQPAILKQIYSELKSGNYSQAQRDAVNDFLNVGMVGSMVGGMAGERPAKPAAPAAEPPPAAAPAAAPEAAATPEAKTATPFEVFQTEKGKYGIFQNDLPVLDPAGNPHEFDSLSDARIAADKMKQRGQPDLQAGKVISPEVAEAAKAQNIKHPIEEVDETKYAEKNDPSNPFSPNGGAFTIERDPSGDPEKGKIIYSKQRFEEEIAGMKADGMTPDQIQKTIEAKLFEERVHLQTTKDEAIRYNGTLTSAEKNLEDQIYYGKRGVKNTDEGRGYEAIRRIKQRLARMKPSEIIQAVGKEKWKLQSLDMLERSIRRSRELWGTEASGVGRDILNGQLANIALARTAIGQQPGSPKRQDEIVQETVDDLEVAAKDYEKNGDKTAAAEMRQMASTLKQKSDEQSFPASPKRFRPVRPLTEEEKSKLPPVSPEQRAAPPGMVPPKAQPELPESVLDRTYKGRGEIGARLPDEYRKEVSDKLTPPLIQSSYFRPSGSAAKPVPSGERVGATESGALPALTGTALEGKASQWLEGEFQKGKLPKIKDLEATLKRATGGRIQEGAAFDMAQRLVADHLQKASGEELTKLYQDELNKRKRRGGGVPVRPVAPVAGAESMEQLRKNSIESLKRTSLQTPVEKKRFFHEMKQDLDTVRARQARRQKVVGYLFDRMARRPLADLKVSLQRTSVKPEDIRYGSEWRYPGKEHISAWQAFSPEAEKTPTVLGGKLVDEAAVSGDVPKTVTRRVTAVMGKQTGKVHLVSTYEERGREQVRLLDPDSGSAKQHSSLESILKRYRVLYSALLDQPVQNFRQDFKDLNDFNERFVKEANDLNTKEKAYEPPKTERRILQRVNLRTGENVGDPFESPLGTDIENAQMLRGEGGDFMGPGREMMSETGEGAIERAGLTSMKPAESRALLNLTADAKSESDVVDALKSLAQKGNRQAIAAITKIGEGLQAKYPNASQAELLNLAAKRILEAHKSSSSLEDFTKKMAAESGTEKEPGSPKRQREDSKQGKLGKLDIQARLRSYLNPQAQKAAQAQMRRDAELGKPKPGDEPGSPKRQRFAPIQEKAQDEITKVGRRLKVVIKQLPRTEAITASLDAADNSARNAGREAGTSVRLESIDSKNKKGKKDVLAGANAMVASGAVAREYQYSAAAYAERLRLQGESPAYQEAVKMLGGKGEPDMYGNEAFNVAKISSKQEAAGREMLRKANRDINKQLLEGGLLNHEGAKYNFSESAKDKLDEFMFRVDTGIKNAENYISKGNAWERVKGRAWKKAAEALKNELEFAKAQWNNPELRSTAMRASKELDQQFDLEHYNGRGSKYDESYLPGRYDGEFFGEAGIVFPGNRILGRNFGAGKVFDTYYHAIEQGPYIPLTRDISNLIEHRVQQGMQKINRGLWVESLFDYKDPVTGAPMVVPAKYSPGSKTVYSPPSAEYELVKVDGSGRPIAVLAGADARLLKTLTNPSYFQSSAIAGDALALSQFLKHTVLMGDFFHLMRVGYYSASIAGRKMQMLPGWAALDMREGDLGRAVKKGVISQKTADYLNEKVAFNNKGSPSMVSRIQLAKLFTQSGYNTGRISDAIYMDVVRNVPGFGTYNKFLFDKYTRGLMMNSAQVEFERISKAHPEMDSNVVMRNVAKDLNAYYGSIGRQGWIKSATALDFMRMTMLAPQWFEGLVKKEISPAQWALSGGKEHGTAARGIARGLATMFILTQVANLITRRQPTWMNKEKDHKWDADIFGVWVSPLSVFNELTHDLIRLNQAKDKTWDAVRQIGENKLGFYGRAALVLATDRKPSGEYLTSSPGVIGEAAAQLIPTPITFGKVGHALASAAAGGRIPPLEPGQAWRQGLATMGIKGQVGSQPISDIGRMASKFAQKNGLKPDVVELIATDQPSYAKLRHAIFVGDERGAARLLVALRQQNESKPGFDNRLVAAMSNWARRPFTGSYAGESMFIDSLDPDDRELYEKAQQQRMDLFNKFADFYQNQPGP